MNRLTARTANEYLLWDEYFMALAFLSAKRSKDPCTQVGACIVNRENKVVGIGYNGMPNGCSDEVFPWARSNEDVLQTKYMYVCHAEMNAVMNRISADLRNCRIYVPLFPCNECAKIIIQSGIRKIIFLSDKYAERPEFIASRLMLDASGVVCEKYSGKTNPITINFEI